MLYLLMWKHLDLSDVPAILSGMRIAQKGLEVDIRFNIQEVLHPSHPNWALLDKGLAEVCPRQGTTVCIGVRVVGEDGDLEWWTEQERDRLFPLCTKQDWFTAEVQ